MNALSRESSRHTVVSLRHYRRQRSGRLSRFDQAFFLCHLLLLYAVGVWWGILMVRFGTPRLLACGFVAVGVFFMLRALLAVWPLFTTAATGKEWIMVSVALATCVLGGMTTLVVVVSNAPVSVKGWWSLGGIVFTLMEAWWIRRITSKYKAYSSSA